MIAHLNQHSQDFCLFFLSGKLLFNKTVEQRQPDFLLIKIVLMRINSFFPLFIFLFVHSFPRRSLSVRFGARSQICGDFRTVRFSRLLCGLVTVLQKEESSVKRLLSIFFTGEVLQLCWSRSNYKDQPEVRCCPLWHALILFVTLHVWHIDIFLRWRFLSYKRYHTRLDIIVGENQWNRSWPKSLYFVAHVVNFEREEVLEQSL